MGCYSVGPLFRFDFSVQAALYTLVENAYIRILLYFSLSLFHSICLLLRYMYTCLNSSLIIYFTILLCFICKFYMCSMWQSPEEAICCAPSPVISEAWIAASLSSARVLFLSGCRFPLPPFKKSPTCMRPLPLGIVCTNRCRQLWQRDLLH
jgi:hypothetical protein